LAGLILLELRVGPPTIGSAAPAPPPVIADVTSLGATLFPVRPLDEFWEIVERPLFDETRRPYEPPEQATQGVATPPPAPATPPPRVVLLGMVITPDSRSALLWDELKRESIRASVGTSVSGWELTEITLEGVTLRQGTSTHKIELLEKQNQQSTYFSYQRSRGQVSQK
jgi:hypothetical protein